MKISVKMDASTTNFTYKRKLVALWESMNHRRGKTFLPCQAYGHWSGTEPSCKMYKEDDVNSSIKGKNQIRTCNYTYNTPQHAIHEQDQMVDHKNELKCIFIFNKINEIY